MARAQGGLGGLLWRSSVRNGFFGGSRLWTTIFAVSAAVKFFRRISGGTADVVATEELAPGQALLITHHADLLHGDKRR